MPKPLKRAAGYGWSYLWAVGQRTLSPEYLKRLENIKFDKSGCKDEDGWIDAKNARGATVRRKVFK